MRNVECDKKCPCFEEVATFVNLTLTFDDHGNGNLTSCLLLMQLCFWFDRIENEVLGPSSMHQMVVDESFSSLFWSMLINFNTFGTVALFNKKCSCKYKKIPYKFRKIIEFYDDIFTRARKLPVDVQCMFSNSKEGCHLFGSVPLHGNLVDCPFKHEAFVKFEKNQCK